MESVYLVRGDASPAAITNSLRALLRTRHHAIGRRRFTVLDTFDGRVRRAGARLIRTGGDGDTTVGWRPRGGLAPLNVRLTQPVHFAWDLPAGRLHDEIAPVIGVRRLLPQADAEEHGSLLDILDDRRKTVARLRIETGQVRRPAPRSAWQPLPTILTLTGLQGYEDAYERLKPVIESRPGIASCPDSVESVILQHAGVTDDLPTLAVELAPDMRAEAGARAIHRALVAILVANEPGVRADLDTEFLHDFRVAVRRTRSLIRQLKHVFPLDHVEHFSTEFSWLGQLTGPARDLDVLVLTVRAETGDLPAADMDAVFAFLRQEHARARHSLLEALDSARYRTLLTTWQEFLARPLAPTATAPDARRPLADVASHRAWRLSKRIARAARAVTQHTDPVELHDIRITAKKLRYLIDVTASFYDERALDQVLSTLKKVQRVLGDFNDAQVQETRLLELA
ncbi:MAG TPA: CHAD domain-containing protein, partial [Vicinamibacterales bacterium]|nr:CHAD domain-containing protein [Vicinamibacterales bacterium]